MKNTVKKLSLLILIAVVALTIGFVIVAVYAFMPGAKDAMNYYLGPTGQSISLAITGAIAGITSSPTWLTYIAPNIFPIGLVGGVLLTMLLLHPLYNRWTGYWAARHDYRLVTTSSTVPMAATPPGATTRVQPLPPLEQAVTPQPTPTAPQQPQEMEKPKA